MYNKIIKLIIIISLVIVSNALAKDIIKIYPRYMYTIDGDTLVFKYHQLPITIRLIGIDTFETKNNKHLLKQIKKFKITKEEAIRRGKMAKRFVKRLFKIGNTYCIRINKKHLKGGYGRYLGEVYLNRNCSGKSLNAILLEQNLAYIY